MNLTGKKITIAVIAVLFLANVFFALKYAGVRSDLVRERSIGARAMLNERVLNFTSLFVEKVLKAKEEVNFEDRLSLETVVRDLNDTEILNQWNTFVNSKTEAEAQGAVKNLLSLLLRKMKG